MPSFTKRDNPGTSYRICADPFCQKLFFVTEDVRQKYCNKTCAKRVKNRKLLESRKSNQRSNVMHNEGAMFKEGYSTPMTTPVRKNTALVNLHESLAWYQRQLNEGLSEIDEKMASMKRQLDENSETLRKINDVRNAISLIEKNIIERNN